jgi:hypothetical protein
MMKNEATGGHRDQQQTRQKEGQSHKRPPYSAGWGQHAAFGLQAIHLPKDPCHQQENS